VALYPATLLNTDTGLPLSCQQIAQDVVRSGLTSDVTDTLPTASEMNMQLNPTWALTQCYFMYFNASDHAVTLAAGDQATQFVGTNVIAAQTARRFYITGDASAAVVESVYSIAIAE
jgi:hypothetical protein